MTREETLKRIEIFAFSTIGKDFYGDSNDPLIVKGSQVDKERLRIVEGAKAGRNQTIDELVFYIQSRYGESKNLGIIEAVQLIEELQKMKV